MALLHATVRAACALGGLQVVALHVHHGLQVAADAWAGHVRAWCDARAAMGDPVSCRVRHLALKPERGDSVEAVARQARQAALADMAREAGASLLLLAHHRQDQAETVLLQALRGAGVAGLAAMPRVRVRDGISWVRPWLHRPRVAIERYVAEHGVPHVDDDSNADPRWARNRLRLQVWPALIGAFPEAELSLSQVAERAADARACLVEWIATERQRCTSGAGEADVALQIAPWLALNGPARREVLRAWFHDVAGRSLPAAWVLRLEREIAQVKSAQWPLTGGALRLYRGALRWHEGSDGGRADRLGTQDHRVACSVPGPGCWPAPGGMLVVERVVRGGVPLGLLARCEWRQRQGGERFQLGPARPPRALKKQFQSQGVPAWARGASLLWSGERLVFVPGLGLDARVVAPEGEPQVTLQWRPPGPGGA